MKSSAPLKNIHGLSASEALIWQLPGYFSIRDIESKLVAYNKEMPALMGYKSTDDVQGTTYYDIRCDKKLNLDQFKAEDELILSGNSIKLMTIAQFANKQRISVYLGEKKPLLNIDNQVIGVLSQYIELPSERVPYILSQVKHPQKNMQFIGSYHIDRLYESYQLSARESECLHFTLRGHSAKKIGNRLKISAKTVEFHLQNLKIKFQVINKAQLVEKAISEGFMFAMPNSLTPLSPSHQRYEHSPN